MAQSDLDTMQTGKRQAANAVEATAGLAGLGKQLNDIENDAAAAAAGVKNAAFINYDAALDKYSARNDVESLTRKNARNNPADFADANFMRAAATGYVGSGSGA